MKNQRILHLMEHIDPAYIAEAAPKKKRGALSWQRWGSVAAAVVLLVGTLTGGYYIFQSGKRNIVPNSDKGSYMDYSGPVFPLTARKNVDGITVEREVTYDFSERETMVTDQYVLKNTKEDAQTISLLYPFGASLADEQKMIPQISVDGTEIETSWYVGAAGKFEQKVSWNAYQTLLADGSYQATAFATSPQLQQKIVVYEFSNVVCEGEGENPTLNVEFEMDYHKTTVMTFGFNGAKNDVDKGAYSRHFSASEPETRYLIVLGEDLKAYTLQGYQDGGCDKGEEISITATVNRSESTLGAFIQERLEETRKDYGLDIWYAMPEEVLFKLVAQQLQEGILAQEGAAKFSFDMVEDAILGAYNAQRVFYVAFDVTIPAGEQLTVGSSFVKKGHSNYDVSGKKEQTYAYDVVTQLGSNLTFTSQKVSVSGMDQVEIKEQNFGFDLKNGIIQVALNSEEPYYWMEIQKGTVTPSETNTGKPTEGPKETPSMGPTPMPTLVPTPMPCTSEEGHQWGNFVVEKGATCLEKGIVARACTKCEEKEVVTIEQLPHTIVVDTAVAATCTSTGLTEGQHCSKCETILVPQKTVEMTEHKAVIDKAVAATCSKTGLTEGSHCSVCDKVLKKQEKIEKVPHSYVKSTVAATCGAEGCTLYKCSCGKSYREDIVPATEQHNFEKVWCSWEGMNYEGIVCANCKLEVCSEGYADGRTGFKDNITVKYYITGSKFSFGVPRTLVIYGTGAMPDYSSSQNELDGTFQPWEDPAYSNEITKIVIKEGITKIGLFAFFHTNYYKNVTQFIVERSSISMGQYAVTGIPCEITYKPNK